jgi:toxin ParE1/3/4
MAQVIWTASALQDVQDLAAYIEIQNSVAAQNFVTTLFNKTDRLELFPESGRKVPELTPMNYREVLVNPCRVIYKTSGNNVYIVHVLRQEQQLRSYLFSDD